jgi:hypothetical protein
VRHAAFLNIKREIIRKKEAIVAGQPEPDPQKKKKKKEKGRKRAMEPQTTDPNLRQVH